MTSSPGKPRIIRESVKDQHTSHWDLDLLSKAELDALMRSEAPEQVVGQSATDADSKPETPARKIDYDPQ